ncbi:xenotropic and polytropic retrovirus receptor 1-like isoform X1 [Homarus americanus]|uniref:xenotropic and polytropic retrovirus receptor 1-like isoform X1 n=1 Tax=Homarus americanus TaxID=6706 RepID=UPI001C46A38E|nr:xenotropic and polytropic retrovirus receptor 1-like isoform X1 [Homarus americanus]XP_042222200.1 xenotropic and polytropic retrovirus receptor 1-like isoform X1 [Homarus americanus]XP_042222201.1 xenotropic and polytropic retrovirus receptor 1-like isoform X1 [Homarus americanus]XP_042222202.1 xenotropic and polytropic retrovirus receptor 1-like isoform X1 [Homarus americanus]
MKFAEHLAAHITPEWRKQYISYEEMKAMLYAAVEQAPSSEVTEAEVITRYYARFDEQFFRVCDKELAKINTFFSEKMAEATRKYTTLKSDLQASKDQHGDGLRNRKGFTFLPKLNVPARKMQDLKLAFSEFYLSLILLQNYQNLNFTGFRKILKKHDKLMTTSDGAKWREDNVDSSTFNTNKDIDKLIQEVEGTFTSELEQGDRQRAMKRLRVPPLGEAQSPWTTFKVGLFSGAFIVLVVSVILSGIFQWGNHNLQIVLRLFRAPLLFILFLFLIGINIYGWRSSGVNHVLIFEIDPRNHLTEQHLIEIAAIFGVIWALSVLGFLYADALSIPSYTVPLALLCFMILFLLNPTRTFHHEARFWLLKKLGRVVCAPFCFVQFADFWLGDQLNTLVQVLKDFEYSLCFYTQGINWYSSNDVNDDVCIDKTQVVRNIVACLPAWWRFAQCLRRYRDTREMFPHLVNAFKYATTFFVVTFSCLRHVYKDQYDDSINNPFFYMWVGSMLFSSCFVFWWDMVMDWGLFEKNSGEYKFLREELVYSSPYYYYFGIVEDFILRFSWSFSLTLTELRITNGEIIVSILAPLEVFRRFIWNFFRLENEHINNCGKFRAVRDISVIPMDASDQAQIVKMMDEADGVINRKKKKAGGKPRKGLDSRPLLAEGTGGGVGESVDEDANYLTVTSVELRNWFRGITGLRNTQTANA